MLSKQTRALITKSKPKHTAFSWPVLVLSALAWFFAVPQSGEIAQAAGILDSLDKDVIRTLSTQLGKPGSKKFCVMGLPKDVPYLALREGPSAQAKLLAKLKPGTGVIALITDEISRDVLIIRTVVDGRPNGPKGWVEAKYLEEVNDLADCEK